MKRLEGKKAVVTGASGGLGTAIAGEFIREGADVAAICHKSEESLKDLAGGHLTIYHMDICNRVSVKEVSDRIIRDMGDPDILVNNAGISDASLFFAMEDSKWDRVIQTNLTGPRDLTRQFLLSMVRNKKGSIVNMSSVNGLIGNPGQSNYCASKAGLIGMTKALSREMAGQGIRVNAIAPGYIDTEMVHAVKEAQREKFRKSIPMKRFGTPGEVAKLAVFLASDDAAYITGQVFVIDGGLTA